VVGADGIHSTVRELAVSASSPSYAGTMAWRSVIPTRPRGILDMMVLMGEGCFFGLAPMGEGCTYGFGAVGGTRFDDPLVGRLERFRRRFVGFGAPVPAYLAALQSDQQLHFGPIEWVELDQWYRGRVVLIAMLRMPAHRIWARAVAWPWKTPWCWRRSSAPRTALRPHSRHTF
jgi:2-polyprenyl-6-methoxyphenol hydroxylase-like FAD-dependent oxidoreductase